MVYYSNTTQIKQCALVYTGTHKPIKPYYIEENITLHVLSIDLSSPTKRLFETKCLAIVKKSLI